MENQSPGAPKERTHQRRLESRCQWHSEPPGERHTRHTGHKAGQVLVNEGLTGLGDSLNNAPNGAALSPGGSAHDHKIWTSTASRGQMERLEVESYGSLLASEGSELDGLSAEEASEEELRTREEDTGELLGGDRGGPGCETNTSPGCDGPPQLVNEKQRFTNSESPKHCFPLCSCQSGSEKLQWGSCEIRGHSCSFSCPHVPSEHGDTFSLDPPGPCDGQEGDDEEEEEEAQCNGGEPEEGVRRKDGDHFNRRKSSRRQRNRSATKEREEGKDDVRREYRAPPTKHKAARKRSHVEGRRPLRPEVPRQLEELAIFCVSTFRMFIDLVVFVTHRCGEYVESGVMFVYTFCCLKSRDLDSVKADLQNSAQGLGQRTRSASLRLKQWACSWAALAFRLLKMLCALLFLVLMLFIGCVRLCWRHANAALTGVVQKLRGTRDGTDRFTSHPGPPFAHRLWASIRECRTWKYVSNLLQKWTLRLWTSKRSRTDGGAAPSPLFSPNATGRCPPSGEVERLLSLADVPEEELNPFQVLGVEMNASDTELKKAYRQLAVLVHPDKNTHPRAEEAFKVVRAAWDIVSNPEKRKEYEIKRMSESELAKSMTELLSKLQEDLKEAMNTMMCSKCQGKHRRFEMERDPLCARYCSECSKSHPAEEGDFWAESSMLGLKITYFAMMDGKVYDITEWAGCQRVGISPDTHRVPYHISFGSKNSGTTGRPRTVPESSPTSAADLQDLFNRIFQGPPGPMPNGGFFTPPQHPPPAPGAASSAPPKPDSVLKAETKPKRKKKVRRPFPR